MDKTGRLVSVGATAIVDLTKFHQIAPASEYALHPRTTGYWICGYPEDRDGFPACTVQIVVPAMDLAKILFPDPA